MIKIVNLNAIGSEVVKEIKKEILRMDLVDTGDLLDSIGFRVDGNDIILFSDAEYAPHLEFGTYDFAKASTGSPKWSSATAKGFKKKDLSKEEAKGLPSGMVSFAFFRRVLYNDKLIESIIRKYS